MFSCKELTRVGTCTGCGCEGCYIRQDQDEFGDLGFSVQTYDGPGYQDTEDELDSDFSNPE